MHIKVVRYPVPTPEERATVAAEHPGLNVHFPADSWEGYVEPEDASWIVFVGTDHRPLMFLNRDENGGVIQGPVIAEGSVTDVTICAADGTWSPPLDSRE